MPDQFWKLCWKMDLEAVRLALQSEQTDIFCRFFSAGGLQLAFQLGIQGEDIDVNSKDGDGRTGLMWAFIRGHFNQLNCNPVAMLLLKHPTIDVSLRTNSGSTALFFAVKNREKYQHILVGENDVDPNIKNSDGDSALMVAVKTREMVLVKLLLADPRVDLDTRDNYRRSKEEIGR